MRALKLLLVIFAVSATLPATASCSSNSPLTSFDIGVNCGLLYGKSFEYVFDGPVEISRLEWPLSGVILAGGSLHAVFCDRFHVYGSARTKAAATQVTAIDEDYNLGPGFYSLSASLTSIDRADIYDIGVGYDFFRCCDPWRNRYSFQGLLGFLYNAWAWTARGGVFGNTNPQPPNQGFLDPADPFATVLRYKQYFWVPYVGVGADMKVCNGLSLGLQGRYTPLAYATAHDDHFLRNLVFIDRIQAANYWAIGATLRQTVWERIEVSVSYYYDNFTKTRGDTAVTDKNTGERFVIPNDGGLSHFANLIDVALSYRF